MELSVLILVSTKKILPILEGLLCPLLNIHVHWYCKELRLQHACLIVCITVH